MGRRGRIPIAAVLALASAIAVAADETPTSDDLAPIHCRHVVVRDEVGYVGQTAGLALWDLSDPVKHRLLGRMHFEATILHVALEGQTAYLSAGAQGMFVVGVSDPAEPELHHWFNPHGKILQVVPAGDGKHLFLAANRHGLTVVELTERVGPAEARNVSTSGAVTALALKGKLLATAEGLDGVRLFDVERPGQPRQIAVVRSAEGARDVAFLDGHLLVAAGRRGLLVYSIEEPRRPELVATIPAERSAHSVASFGQLALVSNGSAGLQVVDPGIDGDPRTLVTVRLRNSYPVGRTTVTENRAYIAADRWGLGIIDLEKPDEPQVLFPRKRAMQVRFP